MAIEYSKKQIYTFTRKLYYHLRHHADALFFQKIRGACGYYDYETDEITIDYRKDIISTLVHEFLHHLHTRMCETSISNHEKAIMNKLSHRQIRNIIKVLGNNV